MQGGIPGLSFAARMGRATLTLLCVTAAAYIAARLAAWDPSEEFGLSLSGLTEWKLWQPVTYLLVHGNLLHLLGNMLGLFFFGPETEDTIGTWRLGWRTASP